MRATLAGAGGLRATADSWFLQGPRTENGFFHFFLRVVKTTTEEKKSMPQSLCAPVSLKYLLPGPSQKKLTEPKQE